MLDMINLSLDLYKMETGTYKSHPAQVDLVGVVRKILAEMRDTVATRGGVVALLDGKVPVEPDSVCLAMGEALLCYTMLANLLKNAVEASPSQADVTVTFGRANGWATVAVHNQGRVPAQVQEAFFEKYATYGKSQGTGLGTYSARLIARTQGGDVSMTTSEAAGTTVTVRLPETTGLPTE